MITTCPRKLPFLVRLCNDVHLIYYTACAQGDVRLVGGETSYEGVVEVCFSGSWVSVCDSRWNVNESTVVCRQLTGEPDPSKSLLFACNMS